MDAARDASGSNPDVCQDIRVSRLGLSEHKFLEVLAKIKPKLINRARRKCSVPEEAEDIVQNAVVTCLRNLNNYDSSKASVRSWIYTALDSDIKDCNKSYYKRRETIISLEDLRGSDVEEDDPDSRETDDEGHDPTTQYEVKISVQQALAKLPKEQRDIAEAVLMQGMTIKKYAKNEGIPQRTAEWRIAQAKEKLKIILADLRVS